MNGQGVQSRGSDPRPSVAILCDYLEEGWPSMDLVGDMLTEQLTVDPEHAVRARQVRPAMLRAFSRALPRSHRAWSADRLYGRFVQYPAWLHRHRAEFDLFHVVDHSYSQLVHVVPANRAIVTCHDLDTFRSVIEPGHVRRGRLFRAMTGRILGAFQKAARVVCDTEAVRDELLSHGLVREERVRVAHLGVHPSCRPAPDLAADARAELFLGARLPGSFEIVHVGSTIPRKDLETLLRVTAAVHAEVGPRVRLVRVGGAFSGPQQRLADELGIAHIVIAAPFLDREVLAAVYRRATVVLLPSRAEGFGLPVVEALACGAPVVASDLPVLREVGGEAVTYCPPGDVIRWRDAVLRLMAEGDAPAAECRRRAATDQAARFTWDGYARKMTDIYVDLLGR